MLTGYDRVKVLAEAKKNITQKRISGIVEEIRRKLKRRNIH